MCGTQPRVEPIGAPRLRLACQIALEEPGESTQLITLGILAESERSMGSIHLLDAERSTVLLVLRLGRVDEIQETLSLGTLAGSEERNAVHVYSLDVQVMGANGQQKSFYCFRE